MFEGHARSQRTVSTCTTSATNSSQRVLTVTKAFQQSNAGVVARL